LGSHKPRLKKNKTFIMKNSKFIDTFSEFMNEGGNLDEEVRKLIKEQTILMKSHPSVTPKIEMVIDTLNDVEIDADTMKYIIDKVGLKHQIKF
jgi:hypothetical protein